MRIILISLFLLIFSSPAFAQLQNKAQEFAKDVPYRDTAQQFRSDRLTAPTPAPGPRIQKEFGEAYDNFQELYDETRDRVADKIEHNVTRHTSHIGNNIKRDLYEASTKIEQWILDAPATAGNPIVEASYCYRVAADVLCYRAPRKGWSHRLVGYQGTNAPPPPPVVTQLLPRRGQQVANAEALARGANPIFVEIPTVDIQEPQKKRTTLGMSNFALPDPNEQVITTPVQGPFH